MTEVILRYQAEVRPNSYDPETRTGEAVIASDRVIAGVKIDFGSFFASGLPQSLPLQTDHDNAVMNKRGEWSDLKIERAADGTSLLVGRFRLSKRTDNEPLHTLLSEGLLRFFSVQFAVSKQRTATDTTTGRKVRIALRGKLVEASFVNNPADPIATIRSEKMPKAKTAPLPDDDNDDPVIETRMTAEQWDTVCRSAGVPDAVREAIRESDAEDADKMKIALAAVEKKTPTVRSDRRPDDQTLDNPTVLRQAAINAFDAINRGQAPEGVASAVFAEGEVAFAKRLLRNAGENIVGMSDSMVLRNAAATSDYAIIAGGTFNLSMRREYEAQASPLNALFGRATVASFNKETSGLVDWTTLSIGDKLENGNYKYSYVDESGETIFVHTIGGITGVSRELSINAAGRLGNLGQKFGKRLAADIADRQVAFIEQASFAGPKMADGKTVFHADRGNIETFTQTEADYIKQLMGFRSDMSKRKGKGNVMIGEYPTHWLVHSEYEEVALRILANITANTIADVNPIAGKLQVVVEPRLSNPAKSWLAAEPAKMDGATRVFLRGHEAPFTDSRQNFDTDAIDFKIRQDFGLGWLEWRSWTRLDHT